MKEIYDFIDNYVKLAYVVRRLNAKLNRLPEFLYARSVECDYRELGLDEEFVSKLEEGASLQDIKDCYDVLSEKVNSMSAEVYSVIYALSPELKQDLYDFLLARSSALTLEATEAQMTYMKTVGQIEEAEKNEDSAQIRVLGKIAKSQYSRFYELDSFKDSYTYLGCYMSSMVGRKFVVDIKAESGIRL